MVARLGAALSSHPGIDMVSVTGSVGTGRKVAAAAAPTVKRLHLELGGKAPVVVFPDADLDALGGEPADRLVCQLRSGLHGGLPGRGCRRCVRRRRRHRSYRGRLDCQWVHLPTRAPKWVRWCHTRNATASRVLSAQARSDGYSIITGGNAPDGPGAFFQPTVVAGVEQGADIVQQEVFGPVVTVQKRR